MYYNVHSVTDIRSHAWNASSSVVELARPRRTVTHPYLAHTHIHTHTHTYPHTHTHTHSHPRDRSLHISCVGQGVEHSNVDGLHRVGAHPTRERARGGARVLSRHTSIVGDL